MIRCLLFSVSVVFAIMVAGCSKGEQTSTPDEFAIRGVRDLILDSAGYGVLPVEVYLTKGERKPVRLYVNLPFEIEPEIDKNSGTPDFSAIFTFRRVRYIQPGVYEASVTGVSGTYRVTCPMRITVPASAFSITGPQTLELSDSKPHILKYSIVQSDGIRDDVQLSVSGLPPFINRSFSVPDGKPDFESDLTLGIGGFPVKGVYPITITGKSATHEQSYDAVVTVPAFNGYVINDTGVYYTDQFRHTVSEFSVSSTEGSTRSEIKGTLGDTWPTADGIYNYNVGMPSSTAVQIDYRSVSLYQHSSTTKSTLVLKITGGKMHFSFFNPLSVYSGAELRTIRLDAGE